MINQLRFAMLAALSAFSAQAAFCQHNGMVYPVNQSDRYVQVSTFRDDTQQTPTGSTCVPPGKRVALKTTLHMWPAYFGGYGLRIDVRGQKSCSEPSFKVIKPINNQMNWKIVIDKNYTVRLSTEVDVFH